MKDGVTERCGSVGPDGETTARGSYPLCLETSAVPRRKSATQAHRMEAMNERF